MPVDLSKENLSALTKTERAILGRLSVISGGLVPLEELISTLIRNGSNSGDPEPMVKVILSRLRAKLTWVQIVNVRGEGWKLVPKAEPPTAGPESKIDPSEMR